MNSNDTRDLEIVSSSVNFEVQGFGASVLQVSDARVPDILTDLNSDAGALDSDPDGSSFFSLPAGSLVFGVGVQNINDNDLTVEGDFTPTGSATYENFSAGAIGAYQSGVTGDFDAFYGSTETGPFANVAITPIPEPSIFIALGSGIGLVFMVIRRKRRLASAQE